MQPERGTGSKAGAQTFSLSYVLTPLTVVLDADSTLTPTSVSDLREVLERDPTVTAACSFVAPRNRRSIWEWGRYIEYLYASGTASRSRISAGVR